MDRFFDWTKIFLLSVLLVCTTSLRGQEPSTTAPSSSEIPAEVLEQLPIDPSQIPPETQEAVRTRAQELRSAGRSDAQIIDALSQEGLLPPELQQRLREQRANAPAATPTQGAVNTPTMSGQGNKEADSAAAKQEAEAEAEQEALINALIQSLPLPDIFGHQIFRDTTGAFTQSLSQAPPDDYIVGPGDVFTVTVWACSELSESLPVAADNSVSRPYIGKVYVGGLTYARARQILINKYRTFISSCSQIEVFIGQSQRNISVNIVGEVLRPGAYKVNAATPAFNALFMAGGITPLGSVRNIQIKRNGRTLQLLDLYEYLVEGEDAPIFLQNNDFIFVPVQDKIAEIAGSVRRPMKYELREDENLQALIHYAGGLLPEARRDAAQVIRIDGNQELLLDLPLEEYLAAPDRDFGIMEGDSVSIKAILPGLRNTVIAKGNVRYPDTYQLRPGQRVSDLIEQAGGLQVDAYLPRAYIIRTMPVTREVLYIPIDLTNLEASDSQINNLELQYLDILWVFSEQDYRDHRRIQIAGEVRKPGFFRASPTMTLKTLLDLAGGPTLNASLQNIELSLVTEAGDVNSDSLGGGDTQRVIRRVSIAEDWQNDPTLDTLMLFPYNRVKLYSRYDYIYTRSMQIEGAVNQPTVIPLKRGMTLKDALYIAGGPTYDANINEVELYRYIDIGEKGRFGTKTDKREIVRIQIDEDWQNSALLDTFQLAPFRRIVVRSEGEFQQIGKVKIHGLVNSPGTYEVLPNMSLLDLFYMAGGLQMMADFEHIELTRVIDVAKDNGEVIPTSIVVKRVSTIQDWQLDSSLNEIKVNSFDQVFVRKNPSFELQESVFVIGEVELPGEYNKINKAERLSSLVNRARGITELAYLEGAVLVRRGIDGPISLKLKRALRNQGGRHDIVLQAGDSLMIPARTDVITIEGNVLQPGTKVVFEPDKRRFKYYTNLAGGFAKGTKKRNCTVAYVDGRVKRTRRFLWFRSYPKVEQGAVLAVAARPEREPKEKGEGRQRISLQEILASLTAVLTFALLLDRTVN